ncbi:MAG TPA: hypothetical protein VIQ02_17590 [Jiangellaceae bacterium]
MAHLVDAPPEEHRHRGRMGEDVESSASFHHVRARRNTPAMPISASAALIFRLGFS